MMQPRLTTSIADEINELEMRAWFLALHNYMSRNTSNMSYEDATRMHRVRTTALLMDEVWRDQMARLMTDNVA